jgi:DNA-binding transcriptional MerR regulator
MLNKLDMTTYSMAQVESLTDISAHTLRIWERRYEFLNPGRTKTNIRFYSDEELVKLLNIRVLIRNGHKISKIDNMSDSEINELVTEILTNIDAENQDEIDILITSMIEMNENEFNKIFQRRAMRKGLQATITDLIYPFLSHIGVLWKTCKIIPAQEHFITNLIRQKIIAAVDSLPMPAENAPSICMFLLDGEDHEIGLLLATYIARDLGWKVYYMGQNMPVANIGQLVEICKPIALFSMFVTATSKKTLRLIESIKSQTDTPLLVSGTMENFSEVKMNKKIILVQSPNDLIECLQKKAQGK